MWWCFKPPRMLFWWSRLQKSFELHLQLSFEYQISRRWRLWYVFGYTWMLLRCWGLLRSISGVGWWSPLSGCCFWIQCWTCFGTNDVVGRNQSNQANPELPKYQTKQIHVWCLRRNWKILMCEKLPLFLQYLLQSMTEKSWWIEDWGNKNSTFYNFVTTTYNTFLHVSHVRFFSESLFFFLPSFWCFLFCNC